MMVTFAWPPPSHMVTIPYRPPVRASEWASVVSSRAPVAPSGWPSAIAPPQALTRARSAPVSRCQASTTGARLLTTLVHALVKTGGRYGMVTMCEGGGQANVTIIERV